MTAAIYARKSTDQSGVSDVTALRRVSGGASPLTPAVKAGASWTSTSTLMTASAAPNSRTVLASCG
jgi:hypothetical protein